MPTRYFISLPDGTAARGSNASLAFSAHGAAEFAEQLQAALREPRLFDRWRATQSEPDDVDPALGAVDANATVVGEQNDLAIDLVLITSLPGDIVRHRMRLLAGSGWQLRDVTAA